MSSEIILWSVFHCLFYLFSTYTHPIFLKYTHLPYSAAVTFLFWFLAPLKCDNPYPRIRVPTVTIKVCFLGGGVPCIHKSNKWRFNPATVVAISTCVCRSSTVTTLSFKTFLYCLLVINILQSLTRTSVTLSQIRAASFGIWIDGFQLQICPHSLSMHP